MMLFSLPLFLLLSVFAFFTGWSSCGVGGLGHGNKGVRDGTGINDNTRAPYMASPLCSFYSGLCRLGSTGAGEGDVRVLHSVVCL